MHDRNIFAFFLITIYTLCFRLDMLDITETTSKTIFSDFTRILTILFLKKKT